MKWQPIETAPKDGAEVLTWDADWQLPLMMHFSSKERFERDYGDPNYMEEGWYVSYRYPEPGFAEEPANPTHWMPLPDPPSL